MAPETMGGALARYQEHDGQLKEVAGREPDVMARIFDLLAARVRHRLRGLQGQHRRPPHPAAAALLTRSDDLGQYLDRIAADPSRARRRSTATPDRRRPGSSAMTRRSTPADGGVPALVEALGAGRGAARLGRGLRDGRGGLQPGDRARRGVSAGGRPRPSASSRRTCTAPRWRRRAPGSQRALERVPAPLRELYSAAPGRRAGVAHLRSHVVFAHHNMPARRALHAARPDLFRNVLIYLSPTCSARR